MTQAKLFDDIPPKAPDVCRRKHGGSPESEAANEKVDKAVWQQKVYDLALRRLDRGITADEAAEYFGVSHNTVAPRISELKREGWLFKRGTRKTRAGSSAGVMFAVAGR